MTEDEAVAAHKAAHTRAKKALEQYEAAKEESRRTRETLVAVRNMVDDGLPSVYPTLDYGGPREHQLLHYRCVVFEASGGRIKVRRHGRRSGAHVYRPGADGRWYHGRGGGFSISDDDVQRAVKALRDRLTSEAP